MKKKIYLKMALGNTISKLLDTITNELSKQVKDNYDCFIY